MSSYFDIPRRYLPIILIEIEPEEPTPLTRCQLLNNAIKQQVISKEETTNII